MVFSLTLNNYICFILRLDPNSEDVAIIESDIRLPPAESAAASGEFSNALRFRSRIWPGGVVPYVLDDSIGMYTVLHFEIPLTRSLANRVV